MASQGSGVGVLGATSSNHSLTRLHEWCALRTAQNILLNYDLSKISDR